MIRGKRKKDTCKKREKQENEGRIKSQEKKESCRSQCEEEEKMGGKKRKGRKVKRG